MMNKILVGFFLFSHFAFLLSAHAHNPATMKTGIGLTLSGGGAKGFAHIGVLHVIDSLDLKIDYVTGTSMGAVIGGMYSVGYSAKEIEEIALSLDWENMFSRRSELVFTHPGKRDFHGKTMLELPIENWRFVIPSGAIEGQQMWNTLGRLFFHVRNLDDFNQFPIPFACVATDVSSGDAVVMQSGDIVKAIRASVAIPTVFTTVEREGKKLIDGGVSMNFPVMKAKEMGAGKVIGVNVSQGLRKADELQTPLDIIYQMGFYQGAQSLAENRRHTDLFIEPDMESYTAASFQDVQAIIEQGKIAGRLHIEEFLKLKEEQPTDSATYEVSHNDLRKIHDFVADTLLFEGLNNVNTRFVRNAVSIQQGDTLNKEKLTSIVKKLYATDYFHRVTYKFTPTENNINGRLLFSFEEKPFGSFGAAIHYNNFAGVGLIGNLSTNKFFFFNTGAYLKVLVGEQPALKGGIDIFTGENQNNWINIEGLAQYIEFPVFENFENVTEYSQSYFRLESSFKSLTGPNSYFSGGTALYYQSLSPNLRTDFSVRGILPPRNSSCDGTITASTAWLSPKVEPALIFIPSSFLTNTPR
ncbi:MAG: patatin-like phospholipase family protein [Bacteroidota bacterium]